MSATALALAPAMAMAIVANIFGRFLSRDLRAAEEAHRVRAAELDRTAASYPMSVALRVRSWR